MADVTLDMFEYATDATAQAAYASDGNFVDTSTKLMLHFNGINGNVPKAITFVGTAQLDTAQKKFGSASLLLDGNSDYITTPDHADWNFGTGNFTIDWWMKMDSCSTYVGIICQYQDTNNYCHIFIDTGSGTRMRVGWVVGGVDKGSYLMNTPYTTTGTWAHWAFVRDGTTGYFFLNGVKQANYPAWGTEFGTNDTGNITGVVNIGAMISAGTYYYLNGSLDEVRISKGITRWTADFTPPKSPHLPDQYTALLLHFEGADAATATYDACGGDERNVGDDKAITYAGTAQLSTAQSKFGGASLLLDGNSDYISVPDSTDWDLGTGDFTVECWMYLTNIAGGMWCSQVDPAVGTPAMYFQAYDGGAGTTRIAVAFYDETKTPNMQFSGDWDTQLAINTWYHIAIVHSGTSCYCFKNGVNVATATWTAGREISAIADALYIGKRSYSASPIYFNGYIDEFRWSKGIARWTANFTPPTTEYAALQDFSESTIKTQGSYSLKGIAEITNSLNKTLTRIVSPTINLSGKNAIKYDIRASRTGANLKLGIHNSTNVISNADIDDEDMADITDWTEGKTGTASSSQVTFDGKSCMKLDSGGAGSGYYVYRIKDTGTFGTRTVISFSIYCDKVGTQANTDCLGFVAYDGTNICNMRFCSDGLFFYNGAAWVEVGTDLVVLDTWQEWTFDINWVTLKADVYLGGTLRVSGVNCYVGAGTNGNVLFIQYGYNTANEISYVNWIKVGSGDLSSTHETTPTINVADTWETKTWGISAVADADKDAIDKITITVVNADA
jgi:hypothetical protein